MADRIWFITGISRGLGFALAAAALDRGDRVVGTTRDGKMPEGLAAERLAVLALDTSGLEPAGDVVRQAHGLHGRLDLIVNNAGYGLLGSIESADASAVQQVFDVNVFGPLAIIRAALPLLRAQGSGHILNISSIAALAPAPGSGIYAATKAALSAMSVSLAQEVAPLGIWVTAVAPGSFRTDFLSDHSMRRTAQTIEDYAATSGRTVDGLLDKHGRQAGDPALAAHAILAAVDAEEPPLDLLLGTDALDRSRRRLDRFESDVRQWEDLSASTDFKA